MVNLPSNLTSLRFPAQYEQNLAFGNPPDSLEELFIGPDLVWKKSWMHSTLDPPFNPPSRSTFLAWTTAAELLDGEWEEEEAQLDDEEDVRSPLPLLVPA